MEREPTDGNKGQVCGGWGWREGRSPQRNRSQTLWIELNEGFFRAKYYPVGAPKHGAQSGDQPKPYPVEPWRAVQGLDGGNGRTVLTEGVEGPSGKVPWTLDAL